MQRNSGWLYFVVGGLVVAIGVLGFLYYQEQQTDRVEMKLELPGGGEVGVTGTVDR